MRMSKPLIIILTLIIAIPLVWFSVFRSTAGVPLSCDAQYDALVKQAKAQLGNGDRTASINTLIAPGTSCAIVKLQPPKMLPRSFETSLRKL